jgi:hypothetical protein
VTEVIDADAFNAVEAAGWERKAAGYDDFFGQITARVIDPLLVRRCWDVATDCSMWPLVRVTWRLAPRREARRWWASTLPTR